MSNLASSHKNDREMGVKKNCDSSAHSNMHWIYAGVNGISKRFVKIENNTLYFISAQVIAFINHARCINSQLFQFIWNANTFDIHTRAHAHTHTLRAQCTRIRIVSQVLNNFKLISWNQMENDVFWLFHLLFHFLFVSSFFLEFLCVVWNSKNIILSPLHHSMSDRIKSIVAYDNFEWHLNKTNDTLFVFSYSSAFFNWRHKTAQVTLLNPLRLRFVIKPIE